MPRRSRPPVYWRTWYIAGPGVLGGVLILALDDRAVLAAGLALLAIVVFFGPWLLAPHSTIARRIAGPSDEEVARSERAADWLGSLPVFGAIWRGAERLTGNAGRREAEAYRRWLREQDDDKPDA